MVWRTANSPIYARYKQNLSHLDIQKVSVLPSVRWRVWRTVVLQAIQRGHRLLGAIPDECGGVAGVKGPFLQGLCRSPPRRCFHLPYLSIICDLQARNLDEIITRSSSPCHVGFRSWSPRLSSASYVELYIVSDDRNDTNFTIDDLLSLSASWVTYAAFLAHSTPRLVLRRHIFFVLLFSWKLRSAHGTNAFNALVARSS